MSGIVRDRHIIGAVGVVVDPPNGGIELESPERGAFRRSLERGIDGAADPPEGGPIDLEDSVES